MPDEGERKVAKGGRNQSERCIRLASGRAIDVWHHASRVVAAKNHCDILEELPECSYEECYEHFERAERLNPGFWKANLYFLACSSFRMGRKEESRVKAQKCLAAVSSTKEDAEYHEKMEKFAKKQKFYSNRLD